MGAVGVVGAQSFSATRSPRCSKKSSKFMHSIIILIGFFYRALHRKQHYTVIRAFIASDGIRATFYPAQQPLDNVCQVLQLI